MISKSLINRAINALQANGRPVNAIRLEPGDQPCC